MPFFSHTSHKKEIIKHKEFVKMYALRAGVSQEEASSQINCFVETIFDGIKENRPITIEHFGNFHIAEYSDSVSFKFNPAQKFKAILGWASSYRGDF